MGCILFICQIKKCGDCWYCQLNPPHLPLEDLKWLPDPTLGPDGTYVPFLDIYGTETTDSARPGLKPSEASEADKKNKSVLNAGILFKDIKYAIFKYKKTSLSFRRN